MLTWLLCVGAGLVLGTPAWSAQLPSAQELTPQTQQLSLSGHLAVLDTATVPSVALADLERAPFQPIAGQVNAGFGKSVIWIRFALLAKQAQAGGTWWLEVPPAHTNHLSVYEQTQQGPVLLGQAGTEYPYAQRQVAYRNGVVVLNVPADARVHTYFIRIEGLTSRAASPKLWRPEAFTAGAQADSMLQGVFYGGILVAAFTSLVLGIWLRERSYVVYALYAFSAGMLQMMAQGYGQAWFFPHATGIFNVTMATAMCLAIGIGAEVLRVTGAPIHLPRAMARYRQVAWLLALGLLPLALSGQYNVVSPLVQLSYMLQAIFSAAVGLMLWHRGVSAAKYFTLAFMAHNVSLLIFLPRNLGWIPLNFWTINCMQITAFIHVLLMSFAVAQQARGIRERADRANSALLEAANRSTQELESKVDERTRALHEAALQANEASRSKTEFLTRVSHDLRSPLTSIMGYAQLLQASGGKAAGQARIIRRSAAHMLNLINDLIDYARGSSSDELNLAPIYTHGLLDGIVQEGRFLAAKNHNQFAVVIRNKLPNVVLIDGKRLRQVLINLLQNAAKFTHRGLIELQVSAYPIGKDTDKVQLVFKVKDTGCGIASEDLERVFTPFFRSGTAQDSEGLGLGLPIVMAWVKRMEGELTLSSKVGTGTTVNVQLPLQLGFEHQMSQPQMLDMADYLPSLDGQGRHVWVVEDSLEIRGLLVDALSDAGFTVHAAAHGSDFVHATSMPLTQMPSLVITDYLMHGGDGHVVLDAVRRKWPLVPVLLLSATQLTMESLGESTGGGFDASLMKPINLADLRNTVARLLGLSTSGADEAPEETLRPPPPDALAQMHLLVDMGAQTDLMDWARTVQKEHPDCVAFAEQVLNLAEAGQMRSIASMGGLRKTTAMT